MKTENDFLETLLKQGPQLSMEQYAAYRRNLRERLARAEREERSMRRIVFVVGGLAGVLWFVWVGLSVNDVLQVLPGIVWAVLVAASTLMPVFAGYAVLLYFLKYRPRLRDAQQQEQRALLLDLQRQLDELRAQLSHPES
jgi:type VI protein secretion system component VasK